MSLLAARDKEWINDRARAISGDEPKRWNARELAAAFVILRRYLGDQWVDDALRGVWKRPRDTPPPDHSYLKRRDELHSFGELLRGGQPDRYGHVIRLAHHLAELLTNADVRGLEAKLDDLKSADFWSTFHELRVGGLFSRADFGVEFVDPSSVSKTPDLKVTTPATEFYVECKRKEPTTKREKDASEALDNLAADLFDTMDEVRINGLVEVKIDGQVLKDRVRKVRELVIGAIRERHGYAQLKGRNFIVRVRSGPPYNIPMEASLFDLGIEGKDVRYAYTLFQVDDSRYRLMERPISPEDMMNPTGTVRNLRSLVVRSTELPDRVKTTLRTIRKGCKQIRAAGGPGIVITQISARPSSFPGDVRDILRGSEALLPQFPEVWQVMLMIDFTEEVKFRGEDATWMRSRVVGTSNPAATSEEAKSLRDFFSDRHPPRHMSLLDY